MRGNENNTRWMKKHLWLYRNQHPPNNNTQSINKNMKEYLKNGIIREEA
jgi:hypothetical protein